MLRTDIFTGTAFDAVTGFAAVLGTVVIVMLGVGIAKEFFRVADGE